MATHDDDDDTRSPDDLLDRAATARALSISVPTLDTWRYRGEGPAYVRLVGRTIRYRRSDLEAWLAARTVGRRAV